MDTYILKKKADGQVITVRDVQLVLLDMLIDIDAICRKHDIPYFLNGGSALGAVRHQGFIPWDDDADIAMMRSDYKRFIRALKTDLDRSKYLFQCFETHDAYNVLIPAMKIRRRGTYVKEANTLLANRCTEEGRDSDGLFIDVFVYDYCSNNRFLDLPLRLGNQLLMPLMIASDNLGHNPLRLKRLFVRNAKLYGRMNQGSAYIGFDLTWTFKNPLKPFLFKYSDIYPVQYVPFEHVMLPIARHPHAYLCTAIAPTYMTLPDEQHRLPKHIVDVDI